MKNKRFEYQNLYGEVRRLSNAHDLMGLIRIGAPDDEYDPETLEILPLIERSLNVSELANGIAAIYNKMFDTDFHATDKWVSKMAADIFQLKKAKKV